MAEEVVIIERSVWVCLLRGITKERERERENLFDGSFSEFQKDGKKEGRSK
jgi:hypothetical protein